MICFRRSTWIGASLFVIAVTVNNLARVTFVSANITTRRNRKHRRIPYAATQPHEQEQEIPSHIQQDPSILVRALARQASDIIPNAISKIKTKTPTQPPEGIYANKPLLRGQLHKWGAILFPPLLGLPLCWKAVRTPPTTTATTPNALRSCLLYCFAIELIMGISATLHTFPWKTEASHQTARKLDFTGIFIGIACCYSSLGRFVMGAHPFWNTIEATVWTCAILGTVLKWKVPDAPHWANASIFLVQGWATLPLVPFLFSERVSRTTAVSLVAGGVFVTLGALAYSLQWPYNIHQKDQFEIVFGPHEMFHLGTILTFVSFWICMWTRISELAV